MIRVFDTTKGQAPPDFSARRGIRDPKVESAVAGIIEDVGKRGDAALFELCRKFDNAQLDSLEVSREEIDGAVSRTDPEFLALLKGAAKNIVAFHEKQRQTGFIMDEKPGILLGQRVIPLERAGVYVPGGTAPYPSTVLMNCIPAKLAGVSEIVVTTPAKNGAVPDDILAAAHVAGADRVFKLGGAQAVAALALGTKSVPKADKIVGPGNIYVAAAKRMVYGLVDIDMIAGPSEILVIADDTADPLCVAADMLSQAEHDVLASAILVTTSRRLARLVEEELERQLDKLPRRDIARRSIDDYGAIVITDALDKAAEISNAIAPEHLELYIQSPFGMLGAIKHAGSVFLGGNAPEALGDYLAGVNHTLPTVGTARFSSALSVEDFVKKSTFVYYERRAFELECADVAAFARREGLEGHARSAEARLGRVGE